METSNPMVNDDIDSHATQLKSDLRTLRADIENLKADVAAAGRNQIDRVRANMAEVDDDLGVRLSEKPFQTLAVAFAAGYLFAVITR